ncbi:MAG: type II toxin-antitoxin system VapC family toxin [Deltaproteobacteria bacterium]|nr:type II toxin-antitoxin system VapC family toxin [Deltaproteobacteria bacterium]
MMTTSMEIKSGNACFVDSSVFYEWMDQSSVYSESILNFLHHKPTPLLTSNFIIAETTSLLTKRLGKKIGTFFLREIFNSKIVEIIRISQAQEEQAMRDYFKYQDKDFDLIDATSFVLCKEKGVREVLTLDKHFKQMGFKTIPTF